MLITKTHPHVTSSAPLPPPHATESRECEVPAARTGRHPPASHGGRDEGNNVLEDVMLLLYLSSEHVGWKELYSRCTKGPSSAVLPVPQRESLHADFFLLLLFVCFFKNPSLANSSLNTRETNTGDYSESAVKRSQRRGAADCSKRGKAGAAHSFHSS